MKAKDISGSSPGGKRTKLADALPLSTPYIVQIFPIYACNFKCNYCIFSVDKEKRNFISSKKIMEFELLKKSIDEMKQFPEKIKTLRFVGIGEPILHKQLPEMIEYTVKSGIANNVELLTNASTLDKKMSDKLINAKLDRLVISLQGVNSNKYKEIADIDIDFNKFVEQIKYFYENISNTNVYIKIVDQALDKNDDKEKFYSIFGDICDTIAIENLVPIHQQVEFEEDIESNQNTTQFGLKVEDIKVCPQPFFTMQINPDGNVVPCYSFEYPEILGNVYDENTIKIWNSEKFNSFRLNMLKKGVQNICSVCKDCTIYKFRMFPEDILDSSINKLIKFYE